MDESQEKRAKFGRDEVAATEVYGHNRNPVKRRRRAGKNRILNKKAVLIVSGIVLLLLLAVTIPVVYYTWDHHTIVEGVKIAGVNVGNMTQTQAQAALDQEITHLKSQTLALDADQKTINISLGDLGLLVSGDQALQNAYAISRKGSFYSKISAKMNAAKGVDFNLTSNWDDKKMTETLNSQLGSYNKPAVDASFAITPQNTMNIKGEQNGSNFDLDALKTQIKALDIFHPSSGVKVAFKDQSPQVTAAQLESQKITGLLATYTTHFDPSQVERSENVRLAANALDKAVVKPGDILSFNNIVGERTVEGGYKDAYIIVDGKFVPGLAGGICQVSSTLYNTGLLANLPVVQRSNHDLAITYVPLGQDATVAYPDLDLKFQNNTGAYLLIRTKTTSNSLTIELYGKVVPGQTVEIANTTESVTQPDEQHVVDQTLKHGVSVIKQQGQPGYLVKSVRTVKIDGKVVSTDPLKQSVYVPLPKIIASGP
ncbi:VanW family protein [Desulfosporosinus sp. PR]|uniref:VanW family protein n=1 Tax=Candidatus Desulfosporosinus nitrosoreducens TaxID=3401928 RepID=UPI0027F3FD4B|nr:VanW family protein [Desulfosporosinus sp. PR]MDQ7092461.1 VanW family protein [Desulfosporosinus sp. PR]